MNTLLVFVKYPTPGEVKTRLAETVGPHRAAELYRSWVDKTFATVQPLRAEVRVIGYYAGATEEQFVADWGSSVDAWHPQPEGDLGARLTEAFRYGHEQPGKVLAIGTDCLDLATDMLRLAIDQLDNKDAVFGPTRDGGYYLVGTRKRLIGLFDGVRWSSKLTLADNLKNCRENKWTVILVPPSRDIDTWEDWLDYCERHNLPP